MSAPVTLVAAAKLTFELRITGVRDDGYHLIDAEMASLSVGDSLTIDPSGDGVTLSGPYAEGIPTDESNLVRRALALTGRRAHVTIDKRIPPGGGLGGGSTDAAAVLRWSGWGGSADQLVTASTIGADIPFCIVGGRARVRGIGEIVEPLPHAARSVTLVIPPLSVDTPAAYRAWDELGGPTADGPNDLEPAACRVEPELVRWRDRIGDACGEHPVLAGSGATWFVPGEHENALAALGNEGARIIAAHTTPPPDPVGSRR
ncbi:MAG: 4-(cytidine 5'-diphospho)-2-C-methyl-D-erythritol kinase [Ilumatobacter sp.]|uniref:4-(cytidine 5'-diphospho)-2-C-methyl-D-erythritol kinase n=1 Tax=Ilumatobacter sp. TaxID=1967498 RepID=UPI002603FEBD|nr:4-(cytidine 5'-diphospho)-2-C-methyl-D-erythritol kinase [Ilumatobacter sp.]MDJ0768842.1 4-(cytidine 5'-diphospho)-2-C-methyl-D-erythritol kinase [Ilumatobacter sp.]